MRRDGQIQAQRIAVLGTIATLPEEDQAAIKALAGKINELVIPPEGADDDLWAKHLLAMGLATVDLFMAQEDAAFKVGPAS